MTTDLLDWHEEDQEIDPEAEYRMVLNGLHRTAGFGLFFVQCSPFRGEQMIQRVRQDLKGKRIDVLKLEEPIQDGNLFKRIQAFLDEHEKTFFTRFKRLIGVSQNTDILFIQGLELSLLDYEESKKRLGWSSEKIFSYSWHGVPPVLINLNQQREHFRDNFKTCFVFLLPVFAVKYLVHRAPDFFDWRSGVARFPDDSIALESESKRISLDSSYDIYTTWPQERRNQRILEIQSLLDSATLTDDKKVYLHCEQGSLFAASKDYVAASASYDAALVIKPDDAMTLYKKRMLYKQKGRISSVVQSPGSFALLHTTSTGYEEPALVANHGKIFDPLHIEKLKEGNRLLNLGRYEEAIAAYDAALAIKPDKHEALNNKGNALFNLGRYEEAIAAYDAALAIKPDDHQALNNKGNALFNLGRNEEAIAAYDAALAIKPDDHQALNNKGNALFNLGRYEEAIAAYDAALAIKPDFHEALNNKGIALFNLGRYEEAIAAYDAALAIKPDDHEALYNKGIALRRLGRYREAIAAYDAALAIKPDYHEALNNKGIALFNLGRYEEAIAAYDAALAIKPDDHEALYNKGIALRRLGRYGEAIAAYDAALAIKPDYHEAWDNRGFALVTAGRGDEGIESFDKAISINPDHANAVYNKAYAMSLKSDLDTAFSLLEQAFVIDPSYREMAKTDTDFDPIRNDPRFQALLRENHGSGMDCAR